MIKTSINTGSYGKGYKQGIDNLYELQQLLEDMPNKIGIYNDLAAQQTVDRIKENIIKRGKPGKYISVRSKKYGPLGMQIVISVDPNSAWLSAGSDKRGYNPLIAAKIFLNTESGMKGRSGFILPMKKNGYLISHNSRGWSKGTWLHRGPVVVPEMGAFHYSSESGVEKIPIKQFASREMVTRLNTIYKTLLNRKSM